LNCVCRTAWTGVTRFELRDQGRSVVNMALCPAVLRKCEQRLGSEEVNKFSKLRHVAVGTVVIKGGRHVSSEWPEF
jgi:hypothetical protein